MRFARIFFGSIGGALLAVGLGFMALARTEMAIATAKLPNVAATVWAQGSYEGQVIIDDGMPSGRALFLVGIGFASFGAAMLAAAAFSGPTRREAPAGRTWAQAPLGAQAGVP